MNLSSHTLRPRRFVINSFGTRHDLVNQLHRFASRFWPATALDAVNVSSAVELILGRLKPRDVIKRVEFWGHGRPGAMTIGDEELTPGSFVPDHPHYSYLSMLRDRLADEAVISFRGCQTFAGKEGKDFACGAAGFFGSGVQVEGQSRMIGFNLDWGGVVCLAAGQLPYWPDVDPRNKAIKKEGNGIVGKMTRFWRGVAKRLHRR